jgi:hypothetical protein
MSRELMYIEGELMKLANEYESAMLKHLDTCDECNKRVSDEMIGMVTLCDEWYIKEREYDKKFQQIETIIALRSVGNDA